MDLDHGLAELVDLWPDLEPSALYNSEPHELALAIRSLCLTSPSLVQRPGEKGA